ncbi:MAG: carboxylate-amine ligase [Alphaproteobacteria bacterium]|nr:carboxylate-amine ligase [Alphaproteobacteria bacterium]MBF0394325.1 carboxylate-amine ligase [Alphaproteobacteria bacterium]
MFTVGIEEEYLLVDRATRDLARDPPRELFERCQRRLGVRVHPEFLRAQIEVSTGVCADMAEARDQLAELRRAVAEVAGEWNLAPIAASTHPFGSWDAQVHTDRARYIALAKDLQGVARRLVICGMHVHVGLDDDELRIDLMNQAAYFLPHLLALSTSSPFWRGQDTGLKSYRVAVFDELPRTGLPEYFDSYGEYLRHVGMLVRAGLIEDGTKLWWDVRPSWRFPTLEMRITDICPRLSDAIAIAALWRCLLRMLWRLRRANQRWRIYARMLVNENRWRAQRYGLDEGLVDFGRGAIVAYPELLDELIALVHEDARALGCLAEVESARDILTRGTGADAQRATHAAALDAGATPREALEAVVDMLIATMLEGT